MEPTYDPASAGSQFFDALAIGDWWGAAGVAVTAATWAIRTGMLSEKVAPSWPRVAAALRDPLVAWSLPLLFSAGLVVGPAVGSGTPFTLSLLMSAIGKVAGSSTITFLGVKNYTERRALKAAGGTP